MSKNPWNIDKNDRHRFAMYVTFILHQMSLTISFLWLVETMSNITEFFSAYTVFTIASNIVVNEKKVISNPVQGTFQTKIRVSHLKTQCSVTQWFFR